MKFLALAQLGRSSVGLYMGGVAILILLFILGGLPLFFDASWRLPSSEIDIENPTFIAAYGTTRLFVGELLSFFFACVGFVVYLRFAHKRPLLAIFTAAPHFRWKRFFGFGLLVTVLLLGVAVLEPLINGQAHAIKWNYNAAEFWPLLLAAFLLLPFQIALEELVFRVYALQGLYQRTKSVWVSMVLSSIMFALLHLENPEVAALGYSVLLYYWMSGLFLALITVQDDGTELAMAFHLVNNLFGVLVITTDWQVFKTSSLFIDQRGPSGVAGTLLGGLVLFSVLYWLLAKKFNWKSLKTLR